MAQQIIIPASGNQTKLELQVAGSPVGSPVTFAPSPTDTVVDVVLTEITTTTTTTKAPTTTTSTTKAPTTTSTTTQSPTGDVTLFGSTSVTLTKRNDGEPLELGVKFQSSKAGFIKGIRFYKASGMTGAHIGSFWNSAGSKTGTVSFTNETATGWQQALFSTPISISANTTYTASVYFASGDYISQLSGLATVISKAPLNTVVGTNGVFKYGTSGFPSTAYQNSNYYIDVIYTDSVGSTSSTTTTTQSSSTTTTTTQAQSTSSTTTGAPVSSAIQGFGAQAVGGSLSSDIRLVSTKAQFDAAIGSNRTIKFTANASFTGRYDLIGISYLTIDGNGFNVTIDNANNGDGVSFDGANTHHCILKGIRVINAGNDGINVLDGAHDIAIINCSSYGNRDGNIDIAGDAKNVTVAYCILGGGASGWAGDMLITSTNVSVHHNLFAPATSNEVGERCPLVHSNYSSVGSPNADIRNNVIWKYGRSGGTGSGYGTAVCYNATGNVVNNYYYTAGSSPDSAVNTDDGYGSGATGKVFASGNISGNGTNPNSVSNHAEYAIPVWAQISPQTACVAARDVVQKAGPAIKTSIEQNIINSITLPGC